MWKSSQFAKYTPGPHPLNILKNDFKETVDSQRLHLIQAETLVLTMDYLFVFLKGSLSLIFSGTHPWAEPGGLTKSVLLDV